MAEPQHLTSPFTFGLPKCRRAERPLAHIAALSQETNIAWGKHAEKGYLQP